MDFGKLPSVEGVDFTLPPEPAANTTLLQTLPKSPLPPLVYLGATGYNMKAWVGSWYPAGAREKEFLTCYGRQFNTIEHNTTHYRIPDEALVARWREEVPNDFRFCPKVPQTISHSRHLGLQSRDLPLFCRMIQGLEEKLGCCFLQLPPQFGTQQLPLLDRFLEQFPVREIPLALEVRHPAFFSDSLSAEDYFQLLQAHGVTAVITDVAGRRDVCHLRLTTASAMIRFVGNGLHPTDYTRIRAWAERLRQWFDLGLRQVWFFCHEPDNLLAPDLTAFAAETFGECIPGAVLRGPEPWRPPAQQGSLF